MSTFEQRLERLRLRVAELSLWRDRTAVNLDGWRFEDEPIALGAPWPRRDGVLHLEHPGTRVPEEWPLHETRLELAPGGEGLLRVTYDEGGDAFGLDPWHRRFPLRQAAFRLAAEVVARLPFGKPQRNPRLETARLVWIDQPVERLHRRLQLVVEAAGALAGDDVAPLLLSAGERVFDQIELPSATDTYLGRAANAPVLTDIWSPPQPAERPEPFPDDARPSLDAAARLLEAALADIRKTHPPVGKLAVSGHAHIDLAWLWPLDETARKAERTFSTMCGLLERYPEATFNQTTAELYELVRERDPELFARIKDRVAEGRWEPTGGMWVEADQNMTSGESLVRQLLYGQRFFEREFGARHRICWLPDCFGFNPSLPQLLRGAGIDSFFTTKLTWSETNKFPYDLWWWEGLDGSRVLAHSFNNAGPRGEGLGGYNGDPRPVSLVTTWREFRGRLTHPESLLTIGYGDGGGGMTADMVEDMRELAAFPGLPTPAFTRLDDFFGRLHETAERDELPVWVGEMYLELHRGTLTTQGRLKRLHRQAERDLVAAESTWSLCRLLGADVARPDLAHAWRLLLRNQFHDILPGSSIREVYETAEPELAEAGATAERAIDQHLGRLAGELAPPGDREAALVVNPDLSPRPFRIELPEPLPGAQQVENGWVATGAGAVAGLEAAIVLGVEAPPAGVSARAEGRVLENGLVRVELAEDGTLASLYDRRAEREALDGPGNQLWAYSDRPRAWDAWDVDQGYTSHGTQLGRPASIEVVEPGPHRAAIQVRWQYRSSTITQVVRLWANSPRVEFATHIDWHERRVLLKARFPLAVRSQQATFETAFGVVERPTHRNTSWEKARFEVAGHRFADLSEPGYGVALLNDGRYGHHARGNELGLSLLRSPIYPDPTADEGEHRFTYALLPHLGSWLEGGVLAEAEDLNRPLLARACRAGGPARRQGITMTGPALGLGALKPAEDGDGVVLRLYEPQGARGRAGVALPDGWRVTSELNLLEDRVGAPELDFRPFQVRSYLLERS